VQTFSVVLAICELYAFCFAHVTDNIPNHQFFSFSSYISIHWWLLAVFWWLYQMLGLFIDSELKACIMVFVALSMHTSGALNLGKTHLRHAPVVWGHKGCNLLVLIFMWVDVLYTLVFALSFSVESGHLSSLASLSIVARARPTFYKMTAFMVRGKCWMYIFWWLCFPTLDLSMLARDHLQIF